MKSRTKNGRDEAHAQRMAERRARQHALATRYGNGQKWADYLDWRRSHFAEHPPYGRTKLYHRLNAAPVPLEMLGEEHA